MSAGRPPHEDRGINFGGPPASPRVRRSIAIFFIVLGVIEIAVPVAIGVDRARFKDTASTLIAEGGVDFALALLTLVAYGLWIGLRRNRRTSS
jgi:hypothetical protein